MPVLEKGFMFLQHKIKKIDSGGCGVAALSMFRYLKKINLINYNDSFAFIYYKDSYNDFLINEMILNNKLIKMPHVPNHVALNIGGVLTDTDGQFFTTCEDVIQNISFEREDFVVDTINNLENWSKEFNRSQLNKISKYFKIDLSDILINECEFCSSY